MRVLKRTVERREHEVFFRAALLLGLLLFAQVVGQAEQLPVRTYTTADGLPRDFVLRIVRDSHGFLWFCTGDGLNKLNLIRGEQTTLTATLSGLEGVSGPVPMQLTNSSPMTVRMEGGETQTITVQPGEFTGGTFTVKRILTGVKPGGFTINAVVSPAILPPGAGGWRTCGRGAPGPENLSRKTEPGQLIVSTSAANRSGSDKLFMRLLSDPWISAFIDGLFPRSASINGSCVDLPPAYAS